MPFRRTPLNKYTWEGRSYTCTEYMYWRDAPTHVLEGRSYINTRGRDAPMYASICIGGTLLHMYWRDPPICDFPPTLRIFQLLHCSEAMPTLRIPQPLHCCKAMVFCFPSLHPLPSPTLIIPQPLHCCEAMVLHCCEAMVFCFPPFSPSALHTLRIP